ncbi:MAG: protease [Candidatus Aminicenantes bacterium]|nr:protease [Candidatus Aminicenantes bacterium]NIM81109.1 protease [Candidatus Aminicenantes bacterium]NIN20483.1 protease [Candidatus Aminicenantes bacterium]NIN44256.1 protease [Candidatus Aminicenantes bacterium]NIN87075.1 protease [Candidatus Aminicenantes bacterium]
MKIERPQGVMLKYVLKAEESYTVGKGVNIDFTLKNLTKKTLWVLTWYTPLEGINGDIFRVTRDGEEIQYIGRMVKRGSPARKDYLRIGPGESVSAKVDLSSAYDLSKAGEYRVEFNGRIHDVAFEEASLPRVKDKHSGMDVRGDAVTLKLIQP